MMKDSLYSHMKQSILYKHLSRWQPYISPPLTWYTIAFIFSIYEIQIEYECTYKLIGKWYFYSPDLKFCFSENYIK